MQYIVHGFTRNEGVKVSLIPLVILVVDGESVVQQDEVTALNVAKMGCKKKAGLPIVSWDTCDPYYYYFIVFYYDYY